LGRILLHAISEGILNAVAFVFLFLGWGIRWILATLLLLGVMFGSGYLVFDRVLSGGEYVTVPDITRRPITEASYLLAEKGLEMGKQQQMADPVAPKYHVIAQRPAAGQVVRAGRKVYPIVSTGPEALKPPALVGKTLQAATDELMRTPFTLGAVARIPNAAVRDTVLAQDPSPETGASRGGKISMLVSDGSSSATFLMPEIIGKPLQEVQAILAPLGVLPVPNRVDDPNAPLDTVLDQQPPAGTLISQGTKVYYSVRPSETVAMPDARSTIRYTYTLPGLGTEHEVRIDSVDRNGARRILFPREQDYVGGLPPRYPAGSAITLPSISFVSEMTMEVYLDGQLVQSAYYRGESEPVITQY
jgi:beta-lactam-binding protein with PASTA domain